jgi:hypothetical protein
MASYKLLVFCLILGLTMGASSAARSLDNLQTGQDEATTVTGGKSNAKESGFQEEKHLFSTPPPSSEEKFLILQPDGKTPADYQRLLTPDQLDTGPKR